MMMMKWWDIHGKVHGKVHGTVHGIVHGNCCHLPIHHGIVVVTVVCLRLLWDEDVVQGRGTVEAKQELRRAPYKSYGLGIMRDTCDQL